MSTILALLLSLIVLEQLIEFLVSVRVVTWHRLLPVDTQDLVKDIKKGILGSDVTGLLLGLQYVLALHGLGLLEIVGVYPAHLVPLLHVVRNS